MLPTNSADTLLQQSHCRLLYLGSSSLLDLYILYQAILHLIWGDIPYGYDQTAHKASPPHTTHDMIALSVELEITVIITTA
jgi:hypothetical protein